MVVHHYFPRDVRVRREALALAEAGYQVTVVALRQQGEAAEERWRDLEVVRHRYSATQEATYRSIWGNTSPSRRRRLDRRRLTPALASAWCISIRRRIFLLSPG